MPNGATQLTVAMEELILLALHEDPEHALADERGNMRFAVLKRLELRPFQRTKDQVSLAFVKLESQGKITRERPAVNRTTRIALCAPLAEDEIAKLRQNKEANVAQFSADR